jgi:hypothetical protein
VETNETNETEYFAYLTLTRLAPGWRNAPVAIHPLPPAGEEKEHMFKTFAAVKRHPTRNRKGPGH